MFDEITSDHLGIIPDFESTTTSASAAVEERVAGEINNILVSSEESHSEEEFDIAPVDRPDPVQSIRVSARVNKKRPAVTWAGESQTSTYAGLTAVDAETS